MAKTPEAAIRSMIQNLPSTTGKTLDQWLAIVRKTRLAKHGEIVARLKTEHALGHGYANLIARSALEGESAPTGDDLVEAQYAGAKAALRPIYDALIAAVRKLGADVAVSPKKTYVSLRRSKQFALIQPSSATRVDVGINLKGVPASARLEASGSFNAMVSHRVRVGAVTEVDRELIGWLRQAYDRG